MIVALERRPDGPFLEVDPKGEIVHMELVDLLARYKGTPVRLEFVDGEIIDAQILHIDGDDHRDFTYDVIRVHTSGPDTDYSRCGAYVAPIDLVKNVSLVHDEG